MYNKPILSIVVGTLNRIDQVKRCVESIQRETITPIKIYITDAGSTDGTIDYLQSIASSNVMPIFVGAKIGQARSYNDVFKVVDTPYVAWLSDDNEVINGALDTAVRIRPGYRYGGAQDPRQAGAFRGGAIYRRHFCGWYP